MVNNRAFFSLSPPVADIPPQTQPVNLQRGTVSGSAPICYKGESLQRVSKVMSDNSSDYHSMK